MPIPALPEGDKWRSMTVVPYLEDLHSVHSTENLKNNFDESSSFGNGC